MPEECRNIYKKARRVAGLTQEAAAERLGISVESVRAYETGQRIPPNDVVEDMVVCYDTQHLAYQHLHETNTLMSRVVPQLEQRSVLEAVVRIYNRMHRFESIHGVERLMAIAEDGEIDGTERIEFEAILEDLREIIRSGLELEVYCADRE
ncbi:MAG: helix-turn-helix domain-containing protein [Lawsonibacter sp.]|jgi:transcriptional regulator with XRE-family HTH domain